MAAMHGYACPEMSHQNARPENNDDQQEA